MDITTIVIAKKTARTASIIFLNCFISLLDRKPTGKRRTKTYRQFDYATLSIVDTTASKAGAVAGSATATTASTAGAAEVNA